jgi:hypothetical protein
MIKVKEWLSRKEKNIQFNIQDKRRNSAVRILDEKLFSKFIPIVDSLIKIENINYMQNISIFEFLDDDIQVELRVFTFAAIGDFSKQGPSVIHLNMSMICELNDVESIADVIAISAKRRLINYVQTKQNA